MLPPITKSMLFMTTRLSRIAALAALALALSWTATDARAQGDAEAGRLIGKTCTGCHGIDRYRNAYPSYHVPRLGGQNPVYIESSLNAYRAGKRDHPTMKAHSQSLSDQDILDLTAWLARIETVKGVATEEELAAIIEVPVCTQCHGANPTAATPDTPILAGQHEDYLAQSLKQYQDGSRVGSVMTGFAATLSDDDIEAVSRYYAAHPGLMTLEKDD